MEAAMLDGRRILVVEDEYLLADDLARALRKVGAFVVGPVASVGAALDLVASEQDLHGAVLDVNIGGDAVYPVVEALAARNVPCIFATGYDATALPPSYQHIPRCEKPVDMTAIARVLSARMN